MIADLADLAATQRLGAAIAARLVAGDVVALTGGLGMGKTTLARAILRALGHAGEVPSPSFAIVEPYTSHDMRLPVVHADFYRLANPREVDELGLDELREGGVLLAEWPEQAGGFAGEPGCLGVALEAHGAGRRATLAPGAGWTARMPVWTIATAPVPPPAEMD